VRRGLAALAAAASLAGCDPGRVSLDRCTADDQCPSGTVCIAGVRQCRPQSGCVSNKDCGLDYFCETTSSRCLPAGECRRDDQCPIGSICEDARCHAGCRTTADCNLGESCVGANCIPGACSRHADCAHQQFCANATVDRPGTCVDAAPPLCLPCGATQAGCGAGSICFIESTGRRAVCGIQCEAARDGADCPRGFGCHSIIANDRCGASCPAGQCLTQEDGLQVCACRSAADCPPFTCVSGICDFTAQPCARDADCGSVPCADGLCLVGHQCAPDIGLTCR
jgi:Cys-rich repeat protein